jgi:hypothetical protein
MDQVQAAELDAWRGADILNARGLRVGASSACFALRGRRKALAIGRNLGFGLDFPCGTFCISPAFPPPLHPTGVKGSLKSQFDFFVPDRGVAERGGGAGMFAQIGELSSRSKWIEE